MKRQVVNHSYSHGVKEVVIREVPETWLEDDSFLDGIYAGAIATTLAFTLIVAVFSSLILAAVLLVIGLGATLLVATSLGGS